MTVEYSDDLVRSLEWNEHIQTRPGMYIGKLGDGSSQDDGIYVLINAIVLRGAVAQIGRAHV